MSNRGFIWNQMQSDGSFKSYRESIKDFEPTQDEFGGLIDDIHSVIGSETTEEFKDTLLYTITLARHRVYGYETTVTSSDQAKDIKKLEGALKRLDKLLNKEDGLLDMTRLSLWSSIQENHPDVERDLVWDTGVCIEAMLEACEITKEKIKGQRRSFTDNDMRRTLAEELARLLDGMGITPTKTRGGKFEKMLRACITLTDFRYKNIRYSLSNPENLGPVIDEALNSYKDGEPFVLLAAR